MFITPKLSPDSFVPQKFTAEGKSVVIHGKKVKYHTVSEDNVFYNDQGKAIASIFSYSYFGDDVKDVTKRPVIFAFNGGPGTSSMYVHAGFLAPMRASYPDDTKVSINQPSSVAPYKAVPNADCLLDCADVVVIDPVGVGYGLLLDENESSKFYGIEEDAEALLMFIESWLTRYKRWNSPKYLMGESYGCTRCATAIGMSVSGGKQNSYAVRFNGTILIGDTVTTGKYYGKEMPVEHAVLRFPTFAAINWYHRHPSEQPVAEFFEEARQFADTEYLLGLYRGESMVGEEREAFIQKIMYYTGVSREYLEKNALRIDEDTFRAEVIKERGLAVGRCDGRFTRPLYVPGLAEEKTGLYDDALMDSYDGYYMGILHDVILPELGIQMDRLYVPSKSLWKSWKTEVEGGTTAERLRDGMNMTYGLRTFFANGYYDACTETGFIYYTLNHGGLPKDRCMVKGYPSGHMLYVGEDTIKALADDVREFVSEI